MPHLLTALNERSLCTEWLLMLGIGIGLILAYFIFSSFILNKTAKYLLSQPWTGVRKEWFSRFRAEFRSIKSMRAMMETGYEKYSKKGKTFVLPNFGNPPWVVLPPSVMHELIDKPDDEIDEKQIHKEMVASRYTESAPLIRNNYQFDIVRRQLTRKLFLLVDDVYDELGLGFDQYWGTSTTDWTTVKIYPTCMKIVSRAANRVFGGSVLCRNEDFLEHSKLYSQGVFGVAAIIKLVPKWLRPVIAPIIAYPTKKNLAICVKYCAPIVKERLENMQRQMRDPDFKWKIPTDALQWVLDESFNQNDPAELDPTIITERLMRLNMVAIHTTSISITNAILNLYSAPGAEVYVEALREECTRVLARNNGKWTKASIAELLRVDSTIRESMRMSDIGSVGLFRTVNDPNGVNFNNNNIHIPPGVRISVPTYSIHHDEAFYPAPHEFNPFRFSGDREEFASRLSSATSSDVASQLSGSSYSLADSQRMLELKNQSLVTVGDNFLAFGNGRHACPGRFFAAQEMKLMLAYLVLNYDIDRMDKRPGGTCIAGVEMPPTKAEIRIRKRA